MTTTFGEPTMTGCAKYAIIVDGNFCSTNEELGVVGEDRLFGPPV